MDIPYNQPISHTQIHPHKQSPLLQNLSHSHSHHNHISDSFLHITNTNQHFSIKNEKNKKQKDKNIQPGCQSQYFQQYNSIHVNIHDNNHNHDGIQKLLKLKLQVSQYNTQQYQFSHSLHNKLVNVKKFHSNHSKINRKQLEKQKLFQKIKNKGKQISIKSAMKNLANLGHCKHSSEVLFNNSQYDSIYFQQRILMSSRTRQRLPHFTHTSQKPIQKQYNSTKNLTMNKTNGFKSKSSTTLKSTNPQMKIKVILKTNRKIQTNNNHKQHEYQPIQLLQSSQIQQNTSKIHTNSTRQNKQITLSEQQQNQTIDLSNKNYDNKYQKCKQLNFRIKKTYKNSKSIKNIKKQGLSNQEQQDKTQMIEINGWQDNQQNNIGTINYHRTGRHYQQHRQQADIQQFIQLSTNLP